MNSTAYYSRYDASLEYNISMYDHIPYVKDEKICGPDKIQLYSGNVIKYYTMDSDEPVSISNQDEKTQAYIWEKEQEEQATLKNEHEENTEDDSADASLQQPDDNN